jgi:hypothetical protein
MRIEGRHLVDLGQRELHLLRQRRKVRRRQVTVTVLDEMEMLDQEIAPARPRVEKRSHLRQRLRIDLAALGGTPGPPAIAGRRAICDTI